MNEAQCQSTVHHMKTALIHDKGSAFFFPQLSKLISNRTSPPIGVADNITPRPNILCSTISPVLNAVSLGVILGLGGDDILDFNKLSFDPVCDLNLFPDL